MKDKQVGMTQGYKEYENYKAGDWLKQKSIFFMISAL